MLFILIVNAGIGLLFCWVAKYDEDPTWRRRARFFVLSSLFAVVLCLLAILCPNYAEFGEAI